MYRRCLYIGGIKMDKQTEYEIEMQLTGRGLEIEYDKFEEVQ